MNRFKKIFAIAIVLILVLAGCKDYEPDVKVSSNSQTFDGGDILQLEGYSIFAEGIALAGLEAEVYDAEVTIFAPTNDAFLVFFAQEGITDLSDVEDLAMALRYHVVSGTIVSDSVAVSHVTLEGSSLFISKRDGSVGVNGKATIIDANNYPEKGVIHGVSRVLEIPEATVIDILKKDDDYSDFVEAIVRVGMMDTLLSATSQFTVLAPSNQALASNMLDLSALTVSDAKEFINFHVMPAHNFTVELADGLYESLLGNDKDDQVQEIQVDGLKFGDLEAEIDSADYNAENGVVHFLENIVVRVQTMDEFLSEGTGAALAFYRLMAEVGWDAMLQKTDTSFTAYIPVSVPAIGDLGSNMAIENYLNQFLFDRTDFRKLDNGDNFISAGKDKYFVIDVGKDALLNGLIDITTSEQLYNGDVYFMDGTPTPLPIDSLISIVMANNVLFAKAMELTRPQYNGGNFTVLTFPESEFTTLTMYDNVDDMDTLKLAEANDLKKLTELGDLVDAHIISSLYLSSSLLSSLPTLTSMSGDKLFFGRVNAKLAIILNTKDAQDTVNRIFFDRTDLLSNTGIVHALEKPLPKPKPK